MKERYMVYQDFNTKDWIVYDNETNCNICHCDSEDEADSVLEGLIWN